jgi:hypothetical protein
VVALENVKINKPVLLIGSGPAIDEYLTPEITKKYFTLCTGRAIYAVEHVNVVTCLDLVRFVHNVSNFTDRWDHFLVPHCLTTRYWTGSKSGLIEITNTTPIYTFSTGSKFPSSTKDWSNIQYTYKKSPKNSKMLAHMTQFESHKSMTGVNEGCTILHPHVPYQDVTRIIPENEDYKIKIFYREDVDLIHSPIDRFLLKDGTLRNHCSCLHFLINWLWLKGIRNIHTVGITREYEGWGYTRQLFDFYGINFNMMEDFGGEIKL